MMRRSGDLQFLVFNGAERLVCKVLLVKLVNILSAGEAELRLGKDFHVGGGFAIAINHSRAVFECDSDVFDGSSHGCGSRGHGRGSRFLVHFGKSRGRHVSVFVGRPLLIISRVPCVKR